jgi:hypothetical protein
MKIKTYAGVLSAAVALSAFAMHAPSAAAEGADIGCKLHFNLTGWSAIYKHAEGSGMVTCADGKSIPVNIEAKGGGLTVGKFKIDNGTGKFSDVHNIHEVLGSYAQGEANAGVVKSGDVQLLTKGTVSLALAGGGEGVDLGISVGAFTLSEPGRK